MLVQWSSTQFLTDFKQKKAQTYKLIMHEFAKLEILNGERLGNMWGRVLAHHKTKAD
jgi:Mlc titration factor MtfA (ptsG expression regulator)